MTTQNTIVEPTQEELLAAFSGLTPTTQDLLKPGVYDAVVRNLRLGKSMTAGELYINGQFEIADNKQHVFGRFMLQGNAAWSGENLFEGLGTTFARAQETGLAPHIGKQVRVQTKVESYEVELDDGTKAVRSRAVVQKVFSPGKGVRPTKVIRNIEAPAPTNQELAAATTCLDF